MPPQQHTQDTVRKHGQEHQEIKNDECPSRSSSNEDQTNSAANSCSLTLGPELHTCQDGHKYQAQSSSSRSSFVVDLTSGVESAMNQCTQTDANNNASRVTQDFPSALPDNQLKDTNVATTNNINDDQSNNRHYGIYSVNSTNTQMTYDESQSICAQLDKPGLLYCSREPLKLKDFKAEVRASMDVEQFCHQAELLLDSKETSMEGIIETMLAKVMKNEGIAIDKLGEIRDAIFVPGSAVLMARTIQGFYSVVDSQDRDHQTASLSHDQSWLCTLCNLSQVSKRHMVFARFKQPINMEENAHQVRLFVLIIVPTKEKSTKDQVETGRTFASMLTDANFRQKLLYARDEIEFRTLMMIKAQQMAKEQRIKNRHKYRLDPRLRESISSTSIDDVRLKSITSAADELVFDGPDGKTLSSTPKPSMGSFSLEQPNDGLKSRFSFNRNPRTSKLFELISDPSTGKSAANGALSTKLSATAPEIGSIESGKLRELKQDTQKGSGAARSGCCSLFGNQTVEFGQGAFDDFKRRLKCYPSDFKDAFVGPPKTIQKTVATIWFLYFGILLPTIAFSSLNNVQTHGHMGDLRKAIIGQAIGGLGFALFGGQPLVIIMTTAPLCLYTKVIHQMCLDYGLPFPAVYAAVGLWNGFFLVIYSLFGFSKLMKWCTRSTEEIFALFIVVAFVTDAGKDLMKNFRRFYFAPACEAQNSRTSSVMTIANQTMLAIATSPAANDTSRHAFRDIEEEIESSVCRRETSLLFVLLMLGTLWLAITLYRFRRTPYLSAGKRDALADYALPTAVILMSLVGSTIFENIYVEKFPPLVDIHFEPARVDLLPWTGVLTSMGLGFMLSLLFFMDQNISAAMVMAPQNRLKKGSAYHYDLLIVGLLNGALSVYGLPMMHGVLPHSPLHARSLADIEERIEEGHLREVVVNSRETRVTGIVAHVLVLLSLLLIPYPIAYIPRAVLNGLFLYMAVTSLDGLQVFERILLLITEQSKYPPNHYIRRCPQRKIHQFTMLQLGQLVIMCLFGFSPITIVEMFFPVFILLMIPFRHKIIPKYIGEKYLDALDGKH